MSLDILIRDRLLIVDDNPKNIQVVANILREKNYSMSFAESGAEAIEMLKSNSYDLILLDIMMPNIDGFEVCQRVKKELNLDTPIIFLSAKSDSNSILRGFELGGVDYIVKPFNSMELLARVKTHLELIRIKRELENDKMYLKAVFNAQKNMMVITDKYRILDANEPFLNFFGVGNLEEFRENHPCICDVFEIVDRDEFLYKKKCGLDWVDYVINRVSTSKVLIKKNTIDFIFTLSVKELNFDIYNMYVCVFTDITELEDKEERLEFLANTDQLTNIANRLRLNRYLDVIIKEFFAREVSNISVVFFDIDFFKKINDTYGHKIGDVVLVELSKLVLNIVEKPNLFARWGGEEFVIVLVDYSLDRAYLFADRLRVLIGEHKFSNIDRLTCSFGVSEFVDGDSDSSLLIRADKALYLAKENGRDRVEKGQ